MTELKISRRKFNETLAAVGLAPFVSALIEGCTTAVAADAKPIKNLVIAMQQGALQGLDPGSQFTPESAIVTKPMYDQLVTAYGQNLTTLLSDYASKWQVSADGLEYVFDLNPDLKFKDGSPASPSDLLFSLNRIRNIKVSNVSYLLDGVKSIDQTGENQITIRLEAVNVDFLNILTTPNLCVLDAKEVRANGGTDDASAATSDKAASYFNDKSLGTGPYYLESWERGQRLILKRNPNYWKGVPAVEQITFVFADPNTQKNLLLRGDAHIMVNVTADVARSIEESAPKDVKLIGGWALGVSYLGWSVSHNPTLAKTDVWDAIKYAVDYEGLSQIYGIGGEPIGSAVPPGLAGALDPKEGFKRDLEKAKAALAKAGVPDGFSFTLTFASDGQMFAVPAPLVAAKIQSDLAEVGIQAKLRPLLYSNLLTEYRAGKLEAVLHFGTAQWTGWSSYLPSFAPNPKRGYSFRQQWVPEYSPEAGKIKDSTDRAKATIDQAKQIELVEETQRLLNRGAPYAFLFANKFIVAYRSDVIKALDLNPSWGFELSSLSAA